MYWANNARRHNQHGTLSAVPAHTEIVLGLVTASLKPEAPPVMMAALGDDIFAILTKLLHAGCS